MSAGNPQRFKTLLCERRLALAAHSEGSKDRRKAVELDQQSVGRLSRQDALQQQAMAKAQDARRKAEIARIDAALTRLEAGEFGWCEECGEEIPARRLEIDPTTIYCAPCASALKP